MRPALLAALIVATAAGLYLGIALPERSRASALGDEQRRLRQQRRELRGRLATEERRAQARRQALQARAAPAGGLDLASVLRRKLVASLAGLPLTGVSLTVQPARAPLAATVRLGAQAGFAAALDLLGRLARPDTGLILTDVRLAPAGSGVTVHVDAFTAEGGA